MISVVVPTYNERENVPELLRRIDACFEGGDRHYEVIIADDDSPDRTWEFAREHADEYPVTTVRRQNERGLATAVLRGVEEARGEWLVVIDADLQHPPEKIPALIGELEDGVDIAVGSRFVEGGGTGDFGPLRLALSKGADVLARLLFSEVRGIEDIQSGFFAFERDVIDGRTLDPIGYKILLEILVMGDYDTVTEVGYVFGSRNAGESKLGYRQLVDYLVHIGSLYRRKRRSPARFRERTAEQGPQ